MCTIHFQVANGIQFGLAAVSWIQMEIVYLTFSIKILRKRSIESPTSNFPLYILLLLLLQQESLQRAKEEDEKRKEISQKFQVCAAKHRDG